MDRRNASAAQIAALTDYMQDHGDISRPGQSSMEHRLESDSLWRELTDKLNGMTGGAIKSTEKWKQTWRDVKSTNKRKALQQSCDTSQTSDAMLSSDSIQCDADSKDNCIPSKRRNVSFDEEIIKIEKEKLELEREYKAQKIEALSRIASALEDLARRKHDNII